MNIKENIQSDLKDAMRARDKKRLDTLRLVTAAIKQIEVDERISVDDARMLQILDKMAKQRKESIAQYKNAERHDLVAQEQFELDIVGLYLPKPLDEDEVVQLVQEAIAECAAASMADMGKVMQWLKPKLQGRADMSHVSKLIKTELQ
jgi:uncharacterized protein